MKKILCFVLILSLVLVAFASCTEKKNASGDDDDVTVHLGGLKGPTTMGLVKLLDDAENGKTENKYDFTMAASADEITPKFLKGELDIIAVPANLGSVLYNKSNGAVRALAVNTLGVIYICEKGGETVKTVSDLKGRTVYATGKGQTPEYVLKYLASQFGIDTETEINIEWKSEPTEIVAQMSTEEDSVAMLPQPFVTVAQTQLENFRIALDLNEVWNSLDNGSHYDTGAVFVRTAFAESHPEIVKMFLKEYASSVEFVNNSPKEASTLVEKYGIVKALVAEKAIPYCNIVCITGNEMKKSLSGFFEILEELNEKAIGGKLPNEDLYMIYE